MFCHVVKKWLAVLGGSVLVVGNIFMLLPDRWTFLQFCSLPLAPTSLTLYRDPSDAMSLVLEDASGQLVVDKPARPPDLPFPLLERQLQNRRIKYMTIVTSIGIEISTEPLPLRIYDPLTGWKYERTHSIPADEKLYDAKVVWRPTASSPIRFFIKDALNLPPGKYWVRARLFAPPGSSQYGPWNDLEYKRIQAPFWPGAVLLREISTDPVMVVIADNEASYTN